MALFGLYSGTFSLGYTTGLNAAFLANPVWSEDLGITSPLATGFVLASHVFGTICSFIPAPYLADALGRRKALGIVAILKLASVIGQTFTTNLAGFAALRFFDGLGTLPMVIYGNVLLVELVSASRRGLLGGLENTAAPLGSLFSALIGYATIRIEGSWSWRLPVLLEVLSPIVLMACLPFIPESQRWMTHGAQGWKHLHARGLFIIFLLGVVLQWSGGAALGSYLPRILEQVNIVTPARQTGINIGAQVVNLVASITGALLADKLGRRTILLTSTAGQAIAVSVIAACLATNSSTAGLVFIFISNWFLSFGFESISSLYVAELFPTELRAKATSLFYGSIGCAVCVNLFTTGLAISALEWKYFIISIIASIVVFVGLAATAVRTEGVVLEEVEY